MSGGDGGLGTTLVGEKITIGQLNVTVTNLIGEGGFSYVYLVKDTDGGNLLGSSHQSNNEREVSPNRNNGSGKNIDGIPKGGPLVLKVTSIHSRAQRDIAEKEAKLLSRLSHPSIVKMYNACYRTASQQQSGKRGKDQSNIGKERPQHLILMEYCEGGHALDVCNKLASVGQRFDLSTLIIAFGQICNAVSYLHAQRPPIVHRDLKPVNFLVKNGAYKLCDFGSAVFGHVDLRTPKARSDAEDVVQKTTTQMFRAPEMIDLFVTKKLTQSTDVWALGCCLYSLAFLKNCFEEGSNLAILSRKYTIPDDNPYGDGLVELIDRMLAVDYKARADMTEVILCLSAVYSGRPLPPRKKPSRSSKSDEKESSKKTAETTQKETIGKFRIDSQGYEENIYDPTKATEAKKLASNSVAARRKRAAASSSSTSAVTSKISSGPSATIATTTAKPTPAPAPAGLPSSQDPLTFSSIQGSEENNTSDVAFSSFGDLNREFSTSQSKGDVDFFQAFDNAKEGQKPKGNDGFDANAFGATGWDEKAHDNGIKKVHTSSTNNNDNLDSNGEKMKKDGSDNPRTKSRRKREGGGRSRANRDVEAGMDNLKINNNDNAGAGAGAGAGRRSRSSRGEEDKESRPRKRSGSRSRRKARGQRPATKPVDETGISGDDDEKKPSSSKSSSIRSIFNRKQGSQDP